MTIGVDNRSRISIKTLAEEIVNGKLTEQEIIDEATQAVVETLCSDNEMARYAIAITMKRTGTKEYNYEHIALFEKTHLEVWREIIALAVHRSFTSNELSDPEPQPQPVSDAQERLDSGIFI